MDKYFLKYEGEVEPVGILSIDIDEDIFDFELNDRYKGTLPQFIVYQGKVSLQESVKRWVLNRAPEPHYQLLDGAMMKAGLTEYDPYGFFKYNGGRFNTDRFYTEVIES